MIAESYERIHRSNLVGMGILPLQFLAGQNAESLKLTGEEVFEIAGVRDLIEHYSAGQKVKVRARGHGAADASSAEPKVEFEALVRIDTPQEALYYANGGILQYVLRQLLAGKPEAVGLQNLRTPISASSHRPGRSVSHSIPCRFRMFYLR